MSTPKTLRATAITDGRETDEATDTVAVQQDWKLEALGALGPDSPGVTVDACPEDADPGGEVPPLELMWRR
jgi:hypothetical protein